MAAENGTGDNGWTDADAGEIVVGTASAEERRAALARVAADPGFAASIARWEARFGPVAEALAEVAELDPPAEVWDRIDAAIGGRDGGAKIVPLPPRKPAETEALERRLRFWKSLATLSVAASLALVVALGLMLATPGTQVGDRAPRYVAVFNAGDELPQMVVSVDLDAGTATVRRVGADPAPAGQTYQLWIAGGGRPAPVSVGLVADETELPITGFGELTDDTILGLSVEQAGGSPTGQPADNALHSTLFVAE